MVTPRKKMGYFPRGGIRNVSSVNSELRPNDRFSILARIRGEERLKHNCWKFCEDLKHTHRTTRRGWSGDWPRAVFIGIITATITQ